MNKIDVCFSPELIKLYDIQEKVVVVTDILRATSCITTGIAHGVKSITPVATLEECKTLQAKGYIAAAERGGQKVEGFDLGNSPFSYMNESFRGKKVAVTTTNGTLSIDLSRDAAQVVIGSFLNLTAVVNYLKSQNRDILVFCAGWKGKFNLEDTLFAGAVVELLKENFELACDAPQAAQILYNQSKDDLLVALANSAHLNRLKNFNTMKDVEFCLTPDQYDVIPVLQGDELVQLEN
ncbi:2-phosphosulfolactate phosphatase [Xanthovirga aplysinae]|uniref:2-phosphosulfolactate phosphatase n=1 Tax=Xanthovirga aplysinae TaxID=2529853 RepID=UPI0012BD6AED|nr:2-phosphosulfolactate phosphatase [Xanthovirga aplysinae]MTI33375.1 2-phosphosulfolactate phosphatase [Xanthovirga aplysinae]